MGGSPVTKVIEFLSAVISGGFWMLGAAFVVIAAIILMPIPLLFGGAQGFRKFFVHVADGYWGFLVRWVEFWGKREFIFSGDPIPERETAFIITNHVWGIDWLNIFSLAARKGMLGVCKFFAKSSVKWIPGLGWGIWVLDYPFLSRNWNKDFNTIKRTFSNLHERKLPFWLVTHVEGTRITPQKLQESQAYAKQHDLPVLEHVLLPRTKGFIATLKGLRERGTCKALYDLTLVYDDGKTCPAYSGIGLRRGGQTRIHVKRYLISDLPTDDETLSDWLLQRWIEKDELIKGFMKNGEFPNRIDLPFKHLPLKLA